METWFGNSFLGKSHFSYTKECFGINFAMPCATKALPTRKNCTRIVFEITVTRFERINFGKLPDTYCIYVSSETLPA